jgi:hypothetical protein
VNKSGKKPTRRCVCCGCRISNRTLGGHDGRPMSGRVWCYRCADNPAQLLLRLGDL